MKLKLSDLKKILDLHAENGASDEIEIWSAKGYGTNHNGTIEFDAKDDHKYSFTITKGSEGDPHNIEVTITRKFTF